MLHNTTMIGARYATIKISNYYREEFHMNKIQSAIAATFVTISLTTAVFAADATKPVVPAPPVVATQVPASIAAKPVVPAPPVVAGQPSAADAAAKRRAANLRERDRKAKAASGTAHKAVVPAPSATGAKSTEKLQEGNMKAKESTKALGGNTPKDASTAVPAVK
jgi:hypothetical protein